MRLIVNGETVDMASQPPTADQLLAELNISSKQVVVEINGTIIKGTDSHGITLRENDHIEIVHFVGGGAHGILPRRLFGSH